MTQTMLADPWGGLIIPPIYPHDAATVPREAYETAASEVSMLTEVAQRMKKRTAAQQDVIVGYRVVLGVALVIVGILAYRLWRKS